MLHIKKITKEHNQEAFDLIKSVYLLEGYSFSEDEFLKYNQSRTLFLLYENENLLGTISLIEDKTTLAVPLALLYNEELQHIRLDYLSIYEVANFAIDKRNTTDPMSKKFLLGSKLLLEEAYKEAKKLSADLLVIAINPKHIPFYKLIGFEEFGPIKLYPLVNAPAVALKFDVSSSDENNFLQCFSR
jgi:hypothetical protein